jgi:hypothetical protein
MSPRLPLLFCCLVTSVVLHAQDSSVRKTERKKDSLPAAIVRDTQALRTDTSAAPPIDSFSGKRPVLAEAPVPIDAFPSEQGAGTAYGTRMKKVFRDHPLLQLLAPAVRVQVLERQRPQTDWIFYLFAALCIILGFIRLAFPKYMNDLFRVFFNTSLRGKQIREQLLMDRLPSLMLNIFFCLSGGVFLYFLLRYLGYFRPERNLAELGACITGVSMLYVGKYLLMEMAGLIFDRRQASEIYSFVVFMVNKMAGLWLLPAGLLLAFASPATQQTVTVFALGGLGILALYRLNRGYMALHNTLKINQLQYLVFVAAFEVVPVLLIYKLLLNFF